MAASTSPQTQTIAERASGCGRRESEALRLRTGEYRAPRCCAPRVPGSHGGGSAARPAPHPLSHPRHSKSLSERQGDEEEAADEEDEEELQPSALDGLDALDALSSSPERTGLCGAETDGISPAEDADTKGGKLYNSPWSQKTPSRQLLFASFTEHNLRCEVCGAQFGTRRGLSSHARSHLRQLGISVSESSGAPIDLLYQIAKERNIDSQISSPLSAKGPPAPAPRKDEDLDDMDEKPIPLCLLAKAVKAVPRSSSSSSTPSPSPGASPAPPHSGSVVRKAPISSLLPVSSPLRSPEHKAGGMKGQSSSLSSTVSAAKPLWAPQEDDAPLNLTLEVDPNKDIVCQLCGAWFETRKGLSSHARAHLRHFGVEYSESKGSPIDLLNRLIHSEDFKHKASTHDARQPHGLSMLSLSSASPPPSLLYKVTTARGGSTSKATSSLLSPPAKRHKSSSMQLFRLSSGELMALPHSDPPKEIGCEFCGEYFENRKGLSSHARSHLRQMGITEWSPRSSAACPSPSPVPPVPAQPTVSKSGSAPPTSSGGLILKLKPEPVQLEVTTPGAVGRSGSFSAEPLGCSWSSADNSFPLNLAMAHEVEPTRDIRCEFCGEYFENRKGLSSHARSHLRQMGITEWSVNGSPIDTLKEVMHKRGVTSSSSDLGVKKESSQGANRLLQSGSRLHKQGLGSVGPSGTPPAGKLFRMSPLGKRPLSEEAQSASRSPPRQLKTFSPLPHDFSYKRKASPDKHGHQDPSCELCGFYFENRKALASHARAHLRQFGVTEWCVNGSPIETLSAWMRSRPQKVLEMHRSYMQGSRSSLKKQKASSSSSSSSSQWSSSLAVSLVRAQSRDVTQGSSKATEGGGAGSDFRAPGARPGCSSPAPPRLGGGLPLQAQVARSELNVRLPRGFERRPLKHPSCPDGTERDSGPPKPPRTGTVPALVPKPPSYPLVKLVGKFYTLKCRFCEVEFHGPLSVQEDWIRHLQQHILKMNYNKPAAPRAASAEPPAPASAPASTSTSTTPALTSTPTGTTAPNSRSPMPAAECARTATAMEVVKVSEEQPALSPTPLPVPPQVV
ncbi:unnamed protein product [Pleuronectes platessa]|uniref:C2H2-type domain-containing protein n=1 Tax=Pleuronectes platessa TaxID=8262 RepID=A0A9N7UN93_PLEPL|nr:unnamed protein product [Pleuronectes platessa]